MLPHVDRQQGHEPVGDHIVLIQRLLDGQRLGFGVDSEPSPAGPFDRRGLSREVLLEVLHASPVLHNRLSQGGIFRGQDAAAIVDGRQILPVHSVAVVASGGEVDARDQLLDGVSVLVLEGRQELVDQAIVLVHVALC